MRVLMLTQVVPNPPDAGPKVKTHYVLRTLAREHSIELLTFARNPAEVEAAEGLKGWCERVTVVPLRRRRALEPFYAARGWLGGTPFLIARDDRRAMSAAIRQRLAAGGIDVLHADQVSMAQYLRLADGTGVRTVFDAHNAVWELVCELAPRQPTPIHRLAAELEWRLLRGFERRLFQASNLTLAVSERDHAALASDGAADARTAIVPIGVEVEGTHFAPPPPDARHLLSVATMHYPPNAEAIRWFRDEIWPRIGPTNAGPAVDIVGTRPPDDLVRWGTADQRVAVHGYVANLDELYRRAAVFIVPLRSGSGVRVKVLEAMARGVPVVSTSIGVEGLEVRHGEQLLIADTTQDFARAVGQLLDAPERRSALAEAARACVLERYDWRRCNRPVLAAYSDLSQGQRQEIQTQMHHLGGT